MDIRQHPVVEQAIDDLRVAWSPDVPSFSREECDDRINRLVVAVAVAVLQEVRKQLCCCCETNNRLVLAMLASLTPEEGQS